MKITRVQVSEVAAPNPLVLARQMVTPEMVQAGVKALYHSDWYDGEYVHVSSSMAPDIVREVLEAAMLRSMSASASFLMPSASDSKQSA